MLVLETICHETLWGGSRLTALSGTNCLKIGHLYSVFSRDGISNRILNTPYAGKTLNEIFGLWKREFHMERYDRFPLTIALTSADEDLSIQVHPNDAMAGQIENMARGKRESWYFLTPPDSGWILNGCVCRSEEEKEKYLAEGRYREMTDTLKVGAGDYVFVHPGTLHSLTAGSLVYEIEEGADFTYRFYDYGRRDANGNLRELQVDKAVMALDFRRKSVCRRYPDSGEIVEETYVTKKLSHIEEYRNDSGTLECLTLLEGGFVCGGVPVAPGMTVLLWPGEKVCDAELRSAIAARLRG